MRYGFMEIRKHRGTITDVKKPFIPSKPDTYEVSYDDEDRFTHLPAEDLTLREAKIVWTPDQIKSMQKASAAEKNDLKKKFSKGKITIKWSQSRAGHAIFVKGRMEGPLFDTEEDAKEYLRDLGIDFASRQVESTELTEAEKKTHTIKLHFYDNASKQGFMKRNNIHPNEIVPGPESKTSLEIFSYPSDPDWEKSPFVYQVDKRKEWHIPNFRESTELQEGVGKFEVKLVNTERRDDPDAPDIIIIKNYKIRVDGKDVGELETDSIFGYVNGKLYGKNLPELSGYGQASDSGPQSNLHKFLKSKTGQRWAKNVPELKESTELTEGKLTVQKLRKIFMNADDWGEDIKNQIYIEGGRLVFIDSYYYGGDKALASLVKSWKPGGSYYDYFKKTYGAHIQVVNSFQEIKATGRHKKFSKNGVVGVELKVESGSDTSQAELEEGVKVKLNEDDSVFVSNAQVKAAQEKNKGAKLTRLKQKGRKDIYRFSGFPNMKGYGIKISGGYNLFDDADSAKQADNAYDAMGEDTRLTEASATPAPTKTKVGNTNWLSSAEYDLVRKKPWFKEDEWEWDSEMTLYGRKTMKETKVLSIPQAKQLTFLDSKQYNQIKKKYGFKAEDWSWNAERKLYEKAVDTYTTLYARLSERFLGEKVAVDFKNKETGDIVAPRNQKLNAKKLKEIAELLVANNCKLAFNRENQDEANSIAEIIKGEDSLQEQKKQPTKRLESFLS